MSVTTKLLCGRLPGKLCFHDCGEIRISSSIMLKGEMRNLIKSSLLFVVYFKETKMPIYSDPQEGSIVQCFKKWQAMQYLLMINWISLDVSLVWLYELIWVD